ncbi:MAG: bifunctional diaminohydroxyphosphoribosylaminopyrimidine deaminase/5-amino-6-(5-phosphoribosylamino)uracil reductase RibD [Campylobacteraceae bacterium]|nr:bifunctional diaminohydroxyphosphoribosylaminopyrimidine deaminase/5-amino-6-(5-phosphoribosylamino)uracil reductase RibD [Campylobacteraceae bacterium]
MNDEFYMKLALEKAWKYQVLTYPNPPVGCVIVGGSGEILSIEAHKKAGEGHAELNAVKKALINLNKRNNKGLNFPQNPNEIYNFILKNHSGLLKNAKAYVTLEPCSHHGKTPPCANLLKELGFSEVIIGTKDENKVASGGAEVLKNAGVKVKFSTLEKECKDLIEPFKLWQNRNFSFIKLGMSINGVVEGGIITNLASRTFVHKLRAVIDVLAIGGNTVRVDRPTLDTRLLDESLQTKNPDIFIYSRRSEFDKTIPLFQILNRKVTINSDINLVKNYKLAMFEGGENLVKNLPEFVTHALVFFSPNLLNRANLMAEMNLEPLYLGNLDDNFYGWFKIKR